MSNEYKDWERDKIAEENEIVARYPFLRVRDIDGTIDTNAKFPLMGIEIPCGWHKLFFQMCEDIRIAIEKEGCRALNDFYFVQCKEKYNRLICYTNGAESQEVKDILAKYEQMAYYVCTQCGRPAMYETQGYIASFCEDCYIGLAGKQIAERIEFSTEFVTVGISDKWRKRVVSFKDEWKRYCESLG